jgi:hypothetical protein
MFLMFSFISLAFINWGDSCAPYMGMRAKWYWIMHSVLRIVRPLRQRPATLRLHARARGAAELWKGRRRAAPAQATVQNLQGRRALLLGEVGGEIEGLDACGQGRERSQPRKPRVLGAAPQSVWRSARAARPARRRTAPLPFPLREGSQRSVSKRLVAQRRRRARATGGAAHMIDQKIACVGSPPRQSCVGLDG